MGQVIGLELNISNRTRVKTQALLINSSFIPPYQCLILSTEMLVSEKIEALLSRRKARDFYDLYFLLRQRLGVKVVINRKYALSQAIRNLSSKELQRELKIFLPTSQHRLISDLPKALSYELKRL